MPQTTFVNDVNPFIRTKELPPLSVFVPQAVEEIKKLEIGQGIIVPEQRRKACHWSYEVNKALERDGTYIRIRQSTSRGITTLWRVR